MRHSRRVLAVVFSFVAGASCGGVRGPDGLDLIVAPVDTSLTLGAWTALYRHDDVHLDAPVGATTENLCRSAAASVPVNGATVRRSALFYIPDAPPGERFPADTANFARTSCRLGAIWLVYDASDTAAARRFADSLQHVLAARLGPGRAGAQITGLGTGAWQHATSWTIASTHVVLATEPPMLFRDRQTGAVAPRPPRAVVASYASRSGLSPAADHAPSVYGQSHFFLRDADDRVAAQWIDSALAMPGVPAPIERDLKQVLARTRANVPADSMRTPALDSAVMRLVKATRDSMSVLGGPQRAATLFAGDMVIEAYAGVLEADTLSRDMSTFHRLRAADVDYSDAKGPVYVYARPWLWEAYHTDSLSPAGHLAFLALLASGWSTQPDCRDGRAGYDRIIVHGEAALAAGQTDPMIHFFVGEAYRDVYALANGAGGVYAKATDFTARGESARRNAIDHLAAALAALPPSLQPVRHAAWDDAVRLMLGVHTATSFFCFY